MTSQIEALWAQNFARGPPGTLLRHWSADTDGVWDVGVLGFFGQLRAFQGFSDQRSLKRNPFAKDCHRVVHTPNLQCCRGFGIRLRVTSQVPKALGARGL